MKHAVKKAILVTLVATGAHIWGNKNEQELAPFKGHYDLIIQKCSTYPFDIEHSSFNNKHSYSKQQQIFSNRKVLIQHFFGLLSGIFYTFAPRSQSLLDNINQIFALLKRSLYHDLESKMKQLFTFMKQTVTGDYFQEGEIKHQRTIKKVNYLIDKYNDINVTLIDRKTGKLVGTLSYCIETDTKNDSYQAHSFTLEIASEYQKHKIGTKTILQEKYFLEKNFPGIKLRWHAFPGGRNPMTMEQLCNFYEKMGGERYLNYFSYDIKK